MTPVFALGYRLVNVLLATVPQRLFAAGPADRLDLPRAGPPSGALDVERFWFRTAVAGEGLEPAVGSWQVPIDTPDDAVFSLYDEIAKADAIIAATPLDAMPVWWPAEIFPRFPARPLRRIILHVITETATHAGHLDAARELLDGETWLIQS